MSTQPCPGCVGSGMQNLVDDCPTCGGTAKMLIQHSENDSIVATGPHLIALRYTCGKLGRLIEWGFAFQRPDADDTLFDIVLGEAKDSAIKPGEIEASWALNAWAAQAIVNAAQPELTPDQRDALRWRTFRELSWHDSQLFAVSGGKSSVKLGTDCPSGARLDALVDAIAAKKGTSNGTQE